MPKLLIKHRQREWNSIPFWGIIIRMEFNFNDLNGVLLKWNSIPMIQAVRKGKWTNFTYEAFGSIYFRRIGIHWIKWLIKFGIWHSITFQSSDISLSQIHGVEDGNDFMH
jgi:hypothetical protein